MSSAAILFGALRVNLVSVLNESFVSVASNNMSVATEALNYCLTAAFSFEKSMTTSNKIRL